MQSFFFLPDKIIKGYYNNDTLSWLYGRGGGEKPSMRKVRAL